MMDDDVCSVCGETFEEGVTCHHHNTGAEADPHTDDEYDVCQDCGAYWRSVR